MKGNVNMKWVCRRACTGGGAMRLSRSAKEHPLLKLSSKDSRVLAAPRKGLVTTYC